MKGNGDDLMRACARALGWYCSSDAVDHMVSANVEPAPGCGWPRVISRYPIIERLTGDGVLIAVGEYSVCVFNRHFTSEGWRDPSTSTKRYKQVQGLLDILDEYRADTADLPVLVVGDFNAPSHLDTEPEGGPGTEDWSESLLFEAKGFRDTYFELHPEKGGGLTWTGRKNKAGEVTAHWYE